MVTESFDPSMLLRLEAVAIRAARAANARGAAVVISVGGSLIVACRVGLIGEQFQPTADLHNIGLGSEIFFATEQVVDRTAAGAIADSGVSFFASSKFETTSATGYLCVYDQEIRWLSGAQEYILQAFAANVRDLIDLGFLLSQSAGASERLRLLESVVINANDAVIITEAEPLELPGPRILFANPAFTRTTGYELAEIIGKTPRILQGPESSAEARKKLRTALETWTPVEVEILNYKKDGTPFWVELSIVPVSDETGWWTHWVSVQRDVTERKVIEERAVRARIEEAEHAALIYRAFHDELTGLPNRAYFMDRLRAAVNDAQLERVAVLFMDLDRFKIVNDSLGHDVGDQLLLEIAHRLQRSIGSPDILARMGGDEFTFLIEDTRDLRASTALAERILKELDEPIHLGGHEIVAGASVGICSINPRDSTAESALRNADIAMYHAKSLGGRQFAIFDATMHERAISTMQTEVELRSALTLKEFELFYQPLVSLDDERIYGFEALVRWHHPVRGLVLPSAFISIAEETGLIVPLGAWILDEACRQIRVWEAAGLNGLSLNVNLSGYQLFDKTFRSELEHARANLGPHVGQVQLEITESVLLGRTSMADELLQWVRSLGFRIAFDDFGTGFSSLSYLQRFKIDTLKIDSSFISKMEEQSANTEIVRMIVALGNALGMTVVAEGIETPQQRDILLECEAQFGQGYLFSKPVSASEVPTLLVAANTRRIETTARCNK